MKPNKLRQWEAVNLPKLSRQEQLDRGYAVAIPRYALLAAMASIPPKPKQTPWRSTVAHCALFLRRFRLSLCALLLLAGAVRLCAPTIILDQTGHVVTTFPWPSDKTVIVPVVVPNLLLELRTTPVPTGTPAPKP